MKYKIWDRKETLYDDKQAYTPAEVIAKFAPYLINPAAKLIIADMPMQLMVAMEFEATKDVFRRNGAAITDGMTDREVLDAMTEFEENPPVATEPTADERIAAALEFQNLLSM